MFALTSPAFDPDGPIPTRFTCRGDDVSPPLRWEGAPAGAAELELIVDDPDARGFVHWVAAGIPTSATHLAEAASGTAAVPVEGRNSFGRIGWSGPCPPSGTHHYRFRLLAVSTPLRMRREASAQNVLDAARSVTLGEAQLVGTFDAG